MSIVDAARDLAPVLVRDREAAEDAAAMTAEVRAASGAAGMFRLLAPRDVGGVQVTLPELYDVMEEVAASDPTVAWHVANSTVAGRIAGSFGEAEGTALFEDSEHPYGWSSTNGGWPSRSKAASGCRGVGAS